MRAVISGATGAIGMALVELLEKNKIETLVLCRESSARSSRIKESEYVKKADCPLSYHAHQYFRSYHQSRIAEKDASQPLRRQYYDGTALF